MVRRASLVRQLCESVFWFESHGCELSIQGCSVGAPPQKKGKGRVGRKEMVG